MPLVRASFAVDPVTSPNLRLLDHFTEQVFQVVREIVPAAFHHDTVEDALAPGAIEFLPTLTSRRGQRDLVMLDIEVQHTSERHWIGTQAPAEAIWQALKELFPEGFTFNIWPKLVNAGWKADSPDDDLDVDMSMPAAMRRAKEALAKTEALQDRAGRIPEDANWDPTLLWYAHLAHARS